MLKVQNSHLILLYIFFAESFCFIAEAFCVSFVSRMVLSALWDIFVMAFKKIFPRSFKHLCHLGVRVYWSSFFHSVWYLPDSWYVQWFSIWNWVFSWDLDLKPAFVLFLKISFDVGYFKTLCEFVTILLLFYVLVFWPQGMWDLCSRLAVKLAPPALEGEVLTTGPPEESPNLLF